MGPAGDGTLAPPQDTGTLLVILPNNEPGYSAWIKKSKQYKEQMGDFSTRHVGIKPGSPD